MSKNNSFIHWMQYPYDITDCFGASRISPLSGMKNKNQKDWNFRTRFLTFALHAPKAQPLTKPLTGWEAEKSHYGINRKKLIISYWITRRGSSDG